MKLNKHNQSVHRFRFSVSAGSDKGGRKRSGKSPSQARQPFYQTEFFSNELPKLPRVSKEFNRFLKTIPRKLNIAPKKVKAVKTNQKTFNAFMAFRAYYSRGISEAFSAHKNISSPLAYFWSKDPNQLIWKRYAAEYSRQKEDIPFVQWLQRELHIKDDSIKQESNIDYESHHITISGRTEDKFELSNNLRTDMVDLDKVESGSSLQMEEDSTTEGVTKSLKNFKSQAGTVEDVFTSNVSQKNSNTQTFRRFELNAILDIALEKPSERNEVSLDAILRGYEDCNNYFITGV